jgi:hypothetical protein
MFSLKNNNLAGFEPRFSVPEAVNTAPGNLNIYFDSLIVISESV